MTRSKQQLVGHKRRRNAVLVLDKGDQPYSPVVNRVRLQNQTEARLRQWSVVSNLYGLSGRRILEALAEGETDPEKLADLGDDRLKCGRETLVDAVSGRSSARVRSGLGPTDRRRDWRRCQSIPRSRRPGLVGRHHSGK